MVWKHARAILYSIFWLIVSGVATLLGLAPETLITRMLGPEQTAMFVKIMTNIDTESMRWAFVILGNCATAMAILWLVSIPQWRLGQQIKDNKLEYSEKLKWAEDELKAVKAALAVVRKNSKKQEQTAKRLNAMTRNALQKWRAQRLDDIK